MTDNSDYAFSLSQPDKSTKAWTVDLMTATLRHENGLTVKMQLTVSEEWTAVPANAHEWVFEDPDGPNLLQLLKGLLEEATTVFIEALKTSPESARR